MAIVEEGLGQWLNPSSLPAPPQPPVPPQQKYRPPLAGNMYRDLECGASAIDRPIIKPEEVYNLRRRER